MINPALPGSGMLPWGINIFAAGVNLDNNYAYLPQQSVLGLPSQNSFEPAFYDPAVLKGFGNIMIQGPSGFVKYNDFTFGLYTAGRSAGFILSETKDEGFQELSDIQKEITYNVPGFLSGILNWTEIGLNGEMQLSESKTGSLNLGINLKLLMGFDAYTGQGKAPFSFNRHDVNTDVSNFYYDYAYTTNLGSNRMTDISNYEINAMGSGIDLGLTYSEKSKKQIHRNTGYSIKYGASIADIGFLRFNDNAGTYQLISNESFTALNSDIDSISDLDEFTKIASKIIYDNPRASRTGNSFTMLTPAALILFADKNIGKGVFINMLFTQRFSFLENNMIGRANIVAVTPRYEKAKFAFSLPVVLTEYSDLHLGASLRFLFFTIGSDDVLSVLAPGNLDGTDMYFALRIDPFWLSGTSLQGIEYKPNRRRQVKCPAMY